MTKAERAKWNELVSLLSDLGYTPELVARMVGNAADELARSGTSLVSERHAANSEILYNFAWKHEGHPNLQSDWKVRKAIEANTFGNGERYRKYLLTAAQ